MVGVCQAKHTKNTNGFNNVDIIWCVTYPYDFEKMDEYRHINPSTYCLSGRLSEKMIGEMEEGITEWWRALLASELP